MEQSMNDDKNQQNKQENEKMVLITEKQLLSRLLYPNPVCILCVESTNEKDELIRNCMTITWLTPVNNVGLFVMSMNNNRYTRMILRKQKKFTLNIPTKMEEQLVLEIGGCSGKDDDKIMHLKINVCKPGFFNYDDEKKQMFEKKIEISNKIENEKKNETNSLKSEEIASTFKNVSETTKRKERKEQKKKENPTSTSDLWSIANCCSHIECEIISESDLDGHHTLFTCQMHRAYVLPNYWNGKNFVVQHSEKDPPFLVSCFFNLFLRFNFLFFFFFFIDISWNEEIWICL